MEEIWKDVIGYEGLYQVSSIGRIMSIKQKRNKILSIYLGKSGYNTVCISKKGKRKTLPLHRLIAKTFLEIKPDTEVNHIDGNKSNNNIKNLERCTHKENLIHARDVIGCNFGWRKGIYYLDYYGCIKVKQFDLYGKFIKLWNSLSEIHRELGYSRGNIRKCCIGNIKQSYGYIWKYDK